MKQVQKILVALLVVQLIVLGVLIYSGNRQFGGRSSSSGYSDGYTYTQLTGSVATTSLIQTGYTVLGSVIITEDQAGAVVLYDATSTAAVDDGNTSLITRIADFETASAEGVYEFDVELYSGLVFSSADGFVFAGDWTITYQ